MPPLYTYVCNECQVEADVIRPMADSDLPVSDEDFGKHAETCSNTPKAYSKIMKGAPKKAYAPGWGSDRKGRYGGGWWE